MIADQFRVDLVQSLAIVCLALAMCVFAWRDRRQEVNVDYVERVFYTHDGGCSKTKFHPANENGLRTCIECSGVFDKAGKGVCVTSKLFDEQYNLGSTNVDRDHIMRSMRRTAN